MKILPKNSRILKIYPSKKCQLLQWLTMTVKNRMLISERSNLKEEDNPKKYLFLYAKKKPNNQYLGVNNLFLHKH